MAPRELYPERNAQIIAKRKAGIWPRQIAKEMGLSIGCVVGTLRRAGLCDPMGTINRCAKLTPASVREIRRLATDGTNRTYGSLATAFGVSQPTIFGVVSGKTHAHVRQDA